MFLFSETDDIKHLSVMRSISVTLTAFFVATGLYLLLNGKTNGLWMLLLSTTSAFIAWDAHQTYKVVDNVELRRKKLGY
jgi:hypothetical protein